MLIAFKAGMIIVIYIFSTFIKTFREKNRNFENTDDLANVIERMIEKI